LYPEIATHILARPVSLVTEDLCGCFPQALQELAGTVPVSPHLVFSSSQYMKYSFISIDSLISVVDALSLISYHLTSLFCIHTMTFEA
jgi:hypothetical protein